MEKKTESTDKKVAKGTVASEIWNEIKDKKIEMFALPDQEVHMYCNPIEVEPSKLYLTLTAAAALPALEFALGSKFSIERVDRFIVVTKK